MSDKENGKRGLQPIHERAIDILMTGASITKTAKELGVSRQTVSDWKNHYERFREAYNDRRLESREASTNALLSIVPKAIAVLEQKLDGDKGLQAAVQVVRAAVAYADSDLREAKFQQMTQSEMMRDLLRLITELSKSNNQTFDTIMKNELAWPILKREEKIGPREGADSGSAQDKKKSPT